MTAWRLEFKPSALRDLTELPKDAQMAIGTALETLLDEMANPGETRRSNRR